jgi:HEPN domain-containing protein
LAGAKGLALIKPPLNDLICFHCQQSAEKYLKSLIQQLGLIVPRTHKLEDLLRLLLPRDATLKPLRRTLVSLSRYAVDFRYPDENATRREALTALRHAEKVRKELRSRLGLKP